MFDFMAQVLGHSNSTGNGFHLMEQALKSRQAVVSFSGNFLWHCFTCLFRKQAIIVDHRFCIYVCVYLSPLLVCLSIFHDTVGFFFVYLCVCLCGGPF